MWTRDNCLLVLGQEIHHSRIHFQKDFLQLAVGTRVPLQLPELKKDVFLDKVLGLSGMSDAMVLVVTAT